MVSSLVYGGAEKQAVEDANMLCRGNKVFLITFENGPLGKLIDTRIPVIVLRKMGYLITSLKIASFIRKHKILIVHAHLFAPMVYSAIAGKITGIPVIWNFHSHAYGNSVKAKILHKYAARLSSVKKILFPATELDLYYIAEGYGFKRKKCQLAYNSGQQFEKPSVNLNDAANLKIHIGYVGRVVPLKRVHLLIELAVFLVQNHINSFIIDVVGDGQELEKLVQSMRAKKLESFILFHGFQHDTLSWYRRFDIFALPSEEEVLSLSLIDAGLSGIPSVAFNVGGNHEIIMDEFTGFLVNSSEAFCERIRDLIQDEVLREKLGTNAQNECLLKFSHEVRLDLLSKVYAEFV